ncbi:MAG TPA: SH3 domain-containing protein [Woeseiaceae bacterium]|nr:SH3 domain-containing protein [Woeseiaceae bacterium]
MKSYSSSAAVVAAGFVIVAALAGLGPTAARADYVATSGRVESFVNVRATPAADGEVVGRLARGERAEFVQTIDGWHEIVTPDGTTGFVHGDWAVIVVEPHSATSIDGDAVDDGEGPADGVAAAPAEPARAEPPIEEPVADEPVADEPVADETGEAETTVVEPAAEPAGAASAPPPAESVPLGTLTSRGNDNFLVRFDGESRGQPSQVYDDGNFVGIGTTEPQQRLEVNGSIRINEQASNMAGLMITQAGGETGYLLHNRANTLTIGAGSVDRITVDRDGNVGIGESRPIHPLQMASGAHVTAGGAWTNVSSRAAKEDITPLAADEAMEAVRHMQPVRFRYRGADAETYVGFIAEDVPELVAMADRQGLSSMDIAAVLTRVVQSQQQQIEALERRLEAVEAR